MRYVGQNATMVPCGPGSRRPCIGSGIGDGGDLAAQPGAVTSQRRLESAVVADDGSAVTGVGAVGELEQFTESSAAAIGNQMRIVVSPAWRCFRCRTNQECDRCESGILRTHKRPEPSPRDDGSSRLYRTRLRS